MARRIILATAEGAPLRGLLERICRKVASDHGVEFQVLSDDWEFLYKHAKRDEYGGIDLPQVFIETEQGEIIHVMTRIPLTPDGKPDIKAAEELLSKALEKPG